MTTDQRATTGIGPAATNGTGPGALDVRAVTAGYGPVTVLRDVSLHLGAGQALALLGPNGAGKTTLLRVIAGLLTHRHGSVHLDGQDVTALAPHRRGRHGLCHIMEGRGVFRHLTVRDNLRLFLPPWRQDPEAIEVALEAFPVLGARLGQLAGSMSGGEQQMLALSRAYLSDPQVVLVDEASMGLSPRLVDEIFASMADLARRGVALVVVEQYVARALELAQRVVVLSQGAVTFEGAAADVDEAALAEHYLGGA